MLDFGIARLKEAPEDATRTLAGTVLGTPAFAPPELARGEIDRLDERTDLWSVGATLFTLLTGRHVHEAPTRNEQLGRAMILPARPVASVASGLPSSLCAVIDRALAFNPDERFQDAITMRMALVEALDGSPLVSHGGDSARRASSGEWRVEETLPERLSPHAATPRRARASFRSVVGLSSPVAIGLDRKSVV